MGFRRGHLYYFVTVAEEGQITRAAQKLHIAQPALSHAMTQLEGEVGIQLFERHPRGVTLTPAGKAFLAKARAACVAESDAARTAEALARSTRGTLAVGFIGPPPSLSHPELLAALAADYPELEVSFQDLPFPCGATADWLAAVDVAICVAPRVEEGVCTRAIRIEPRALVASRSHPLADRGELGVADVLDETFVSYHPDVQQEWAGFHSLDDHRGSAPSSVTGDQALTSLHMLAVMSSGHAVTTVPLADALVAKQVVPGAAVIPLADADPARVSLVWCQDSPNRHVASLLATAERLGPGPNGATRPVRAQARHSR
jgi:DNA-binding transcriptional LysR family regulator